MSYQTVDARVAEADNGGTQRDDAELLGNYQVLEVYWMTGMAHWLV